MSIALTFEAMFQCVGITPFNFPAMVPMWLYPMAITLGNAFVLKPSEKVPLTPQILGELMLAAGYPPGVFSIVNGARETVEALVDHPDIQAVGFVGSTPAAKAVYARASAAGKRALALGGAGIPSPMKKPGCGGWLYAVFCHAIATRYCGSCSSVFARCSRCPMPFESPVAGRSWNVDRPQNDATERTVCRRWRPRRP